MAIAFGGITSVQTSTTGTSPTISGSDTIGIVFQVDGNAGSDATSAVKWNATSMSLIGRIQCPSDRWLSVWYIINPASASVIEVTSSFYRWFAAYYTGVKQSGQPDSSNTNSNSGQTSIGVATTVVADGCWQVIIAKDDQGGQTYTTSVGSMRANADAGGIAIADSNGTVSTGSQTMTLSAQTANRGAVSFSLAPSGVVATAVTPQDNLAMLGVS